MYAISIVNSSSIHWSKTHSYTQLHLLFTINKSMSIVASDLNVPLLPISQLIEMVDPRTHSNNTYSGLETDLKDIHTAIKNKYCPVIMHTPFVPVKVLKLSKGRFLVVSSHKQAAYLNADGSTEGIFDLSTTCPDEIKKIALISETEILVVDYWWKIRHINIEIPELVRVYTMHDHVIVQILVPKSRDFFYSISVDSTLRKSYLNDSKDSSILMHVRDKPSCMSLSSDENYIIFADIANTIYIFSVSIGECIKQLQTENECSSVILSNSNKFLCCANKEYIHIWQFGSWELVKKFYGKSTTYSYLDINESDTLLAASTSDGAIHIWNLMKFHYSPIKNTGIEKLIQEVHFIDDKKVYYFSTEMARVLFWEVPQGIEEYTIRPKSADLVKNVFISEKLQLLIVDLEGNGFQVWNLNDLSCSHYHEGMNGAIDLHYDNRTHISALYNADQYQLVMEHLNLNTMQMYREDFVNYGEKWWATGIIFIKNQTDDSICLCCANGCVDIRAGYGYDNIRADWPLTDSEIACVNTSYSGKFLIVGNLTGEVKMFNLVNYSNEGDFPSHEAMISAIEISRKDVYLISGSSDGVIKVSYIPTKMLVKMLVLHDKAILKLYVSSNDTHLLVGSRDNRISIWDLRSLTLCSVKPHFYNFAISGEENYMVLIGDSTWEVIQNPLKSTTIATFGTIFESVDYYQYLCELMGNEPPRYRPEFNNWVISSKMYNVMHFYAYFHLTSHLKRAIDENAYFVKTVDGVSPLSICLQYNSLVVGHIVEALLKQMKKNEGLAQFFEGNLVKLNSFKHEQIAMIYTSLFKLVETVNFPEHCSTSVTLPVIKSVDNILSIQFADFIKKTDENEIPQPIVFRHFSIGIPLIPGTHESIDFLYSLIDSPNDQIFRSEFIQLIMNYRWKTVRSIMILQGFLYLLYLIGLVLHLEYNMNLNVFYATFAISSLLTVYELYQMIVSWKLYFKDPKNFLDLIRIFSFYMYSVYVFTGRADIEWNIVFLVMISLVRGITFFSLFDETRYMIFLLQEVWKDMLAFMILLVYSTAAISVAYLSINPESSFFGYLENSYKLDFGDFNDEPGAFNKLIFMCGSLLNTLIMLNLLISIMGDTFDRVQQSRVEASCKSLAEMILEVELLMFWNRVKRRNSTSSIKYFVICEADSANGSDSGSWEGKIRIILDKVESTRLHMEQYSLKLVEKVESLENDISSVKTIMRDLDFKLDRLLDLRDN